MRDSTTERTKSLSLAIIGLLMGLSLFLAALFRADIAAFYSRIPRDEFGFCAVATIVILPVYTLGALLVCILSELQKKNASKSK